MKGSQPEGLLVAPVVCVCPCQLLYVESPAVVPVSLRSGSSRRLRLATESSFWAGMKLLRQELGSSFRNPFKADGRQMPHSNNSTTSAAKGGSQVVEADDGN